jgi:hypothetical protein
MVRGFDHQILSGDEKLEILAVPIPEPKATETLETREEMADAVRDASPV